MELYNIMMVHVLKLIHFFLNYEKIVSFFLNYAKTGSIALCGLSIERMSECCLPTRDHSLELYHG